EPGIRRCTRSRLLDSGSGADAPSRNDGSLVGWAKARNAPCPPLRADRRITKNWIPAPRLRGDRLRGNERRKDRCLRVSFSVIPGRRTRNPDTEPSIIPRRRFRWRWPGAGSLDLATLSSRKRSAMDALFSCFAILTSPIRYRCRPYTPLDARGCQRCGSLLISWSKNFEARHGALRLHARKI